MRPLPYPGQVKVAQNIVATHQPTEDKPGVCPACTEMGVGSNGGDVEHPCFPYQYNQRRLKHWGLLAGEAPGPADPNPPGVGRVGDQP